VGTNSKRAPRGFFRRGVFRFGFAPLNIMRVQRRQNFGDYLFCSCASLRPSRIAAVTILRCREIEA
jgi:hypothetical protein